MKIRFFEETFTGANGESKTVVMMEGLVESSDRSLPPQHIISIAEPAHIKEYHLEYDEFLKSKGGDPVSASEVVVKKGKKKKDNSELITE